MITIDLLQIIVDFSNIKESLSMCRLNKYTYNKIKIYYLDESHNNVTDDILRQKKYSHLIGLDLNYNFQVKNINHLTNLKILYACGSCGIDNEGISKLNLIEFYADNNGKITKKLENKVFY